MESLLVFLMIFAVLAATGVAVVFTLPRFRFELDGRRFEIRSYGFGEILSVDGQRIPGTRVGGNWLTHATHAVALPDGRQLNVRIATDDGSSFRCIAAIGDRIVYDSTREMPEVGPARARLPDPTPVPARALEGEPADPRWAAARLLLDELAADPEVAPTAGTLAREVRTAMLRLEQGRQAAEAHAALGGTDGDLAAVVVRREEMVAELLGMVRELHLAASGRDAVPAIDDALDRVQAEREVEASRLRAASARSRATN